MNNIFQKLKNSKKPLILDGAMGSLLQQKNVETDSNLWMSKANVTNPEIVERIHTEYINAGADIITTNTFRTNPYALKNSIYKVEDLVQTSLEIAHKATDKTNVLIAGCNPPAEDCYQCERTVTQNELENNHKTHIDLLIKYGSDFILNETQSHFDEIKIICEYCNKSKIPYILSLFFDDELKILSGERVEEIIFFILKFNPLAIGFNCIKPSSFENFLNLIELNYNWGFYLNCGDGTFKDENITCGVSPEAYSKLVIKSLDYSPSFIGSCCGSSPEHTKQIRNTIYG